jgi:hypothetical protein
LNSFEFET